MYALGAFCLAALLNIKKEFSDYSEVYHGIHKKIFSASNATKDNFLFLLEK